MSSELMLLRIKYPTFPIEYLDDLSKVINSFEGYDITDSDHSFWKYNIGISLNNEEVDYIVLYPRDVPYYSCVGDNYFNSIDGVIAHLLGTTCQLRR